MKTRNRQLKEKIQAKMLSLIRKNPGIRPSKLNRLMNLSHSWNLRKSLILKGLIKKQRDGTAIRYFPSHFKKKKRILGILEGKASYRFSKDFKMTEEEFLNS